MALIIMYPMVPLNPLDYLRVSMICSHLFPLKIAICRASSCQKMGRFQRQVGHVGDSTAILGRLGANDQLIPVQLTRARSPRPCGLQRDWSPFFLQNRETVGVRFLVHMT